MKTTFF